MEDGFIKIDLGTVLGGGNEDCGADLEAVVSLRVA